MDGSMNESRELGWAAEERRLWTALTHRITESAHSTAHNSSFHSIPLYLPHLSVLHLCWSHFQSPVLVMPVCQVTGDSGSFPGQGEQGSWGANLRRHTQDPEPEHPLVPPHSCPGGSVSFLLPLRNKITNQETSHNLCCYLPEST